MSVYRPKGSREYWYDFWFDRTRFRAATGQTDKREAKKVQERVKAHLTAQRQQGRRKPEMSLSVATARYFTEVAEHQPSADWTWYLLEACIKHLGKNMKLSALDETALTEMTAKIRAKASNATANRHIELLRRLVKRAARVWKVNTPDIEWGALRFQEPGERVRELTPTEEKKLFANLRQDYHPIVRFCLLTGVRKDNALTLTWDQVDFDAQVITLRIKSRQPGGRLHTIPMTGSLTALLARERGNDPDHVFTYQAVKTRDDNVRGERYPITSSGLRRAWTAALDDAKIRDFRFHDLRHTTATRLLRETGNLKLAQRLLGHKDIATTAKYAHVDDSDLRSAMERTDSPIDPPKSQKDAG